MVSAWAVIGTEVDWRDNYTGSAITTLAETMMVIFSRSKGGRELWRATLNGRTYFFAAVAPDRSAQFGAGPFKILKRAVLLRLGTATGVNNSTSPHGMWLRSVTERPVVLPPF